MNLKRTAARVPIADSGQRQRDGGVGFGVGGRGNVWVEERWDANNRQGLWQDAKCSQRACRERKYCRHFVIR